MRRITQISKLRYLQPTRSFSRSANLLRPQSQQYDTEGRTPGFARRRRSHHNPHHDANQDSTNPSNIPQQTTDNATNSLLAPVHIPEDPEAILNEQHPATSILNNSSIVVQRQIEMMNVFLGFEQANKYIIMDPQGAHIGFLAETDNGLGSALKRQAFRTHRSFTTHVFDKNEKEVLRFHRPFSFINSAIRVYDAVDPSSSSYGTSSALQGLSTNSIVTQNQMPAQISQTPLSEMRVIGEAQQSWAPLRRKYNLFLSRPLYEEPLNPDAPRLTAGDLPLSNSKALTLIENDKTSPGIGFRQFAAVDEPFLSWDFSLRSSDQQLIGSVNRNFSGFAREIFTDTGVYALRMDAAGQDANATEQQAPALGMTLDQRAVMLATAVSIDFDYFSRHSGSVGGFGGGLPMPIWFPIGWGGGGGAAAGTEAGAVGAEGAAAGTAVEGAEAGTAVRGAADAAKGPLGAGEGAIAGAGSLAGYDALQRAREGQAEQRDDFVPDEQPPQQPDTYDPWGQSSQQEQDPWANQNQDPWGGGQSGGGGGGGGGGGDSDWGDFF